MPEFSLRNSNSRCRCRFTSLSHQELAPPFVSAMLGPEACPGAVLWFFFEIPRPVPISVNPFYLSDLGEVNYHGPGISIPSTFFPSLANSPGSRQFPAPSFPFFFPFFLPSGPWVTVEILKLNHYLSQTPPASFGVASFSFSFFTRHNFFSFHTSTVSIFWVFSSDPFSPAFPDIFPAGVNFLVFLVAPHPYDLSRFSLLSTFSRSHFSCSFHFPGPSFLIP